MSSRDEAHERWPENYNMGRWDGITISAERSFLVQRQAFIAGSNWATEESEERVEALARSLVHRVKWEHASRASRYRWREQARLALVALREVNR